MKKVNENLPPTPLLEMRPSLLKKRQRGLTVKEKIVRLTLRTLLAYLDDTLEPLEIKTIGQKVAESDSTQELIERIKQVTRRRRITTPPATGPNSFEPNMVAEYLDNELSSEQVAELEKICLESDVHLAEVAACHQILTLVLGEPAVVPQTAKERMYGLVRGREAIQSRKAAGTHASAPTSEDADADEMFLLGLPFYRRGSWLRWALPIAAILLFVIGGIALWQAIHGVQQPTTTNQVAQGPNRNNEDTQGKEKPAPDTESKNNKKAPVVQPATTNNHSTNPTEGTQQKQTKTDETKPDVTAEKNPSVGKLEKNPDKSAEAPATGRDAPPIQERVAVGQYHIPDYSPPSLLVQRKNDKDGWSRLKPGTRVSTGDEIMSLPGYASEVRLDNGIHLLLRGHVREFTPPEADKMYYLQECALVLHKPAKGIDADLTLKRGRLYISNHKDKDSSPMIVRFRFENKAWDLTLSPDAEIVVDLIKSRSAGEPLAELKMFLLGGNAGIALERDKYPELTVPGWAQFLWDSTNPAYYDRRNISKEDLAFAKNTLFPKSPIVNTEPASSMKRALNAIRDRMTVDKSPEIALKEVLETNQFFEHQLALYCLAAMDEIKDLLDVLSRADQIHAPDRDTAIFALRRWLDHGRGQEERLFNSKDKKGLLRSDMGYTTGEAERFMALLRDPTHEQVLSREYYEDAANALSSEKVAIAELARWRLTLLAVRMFRLDMPRLSAFNAAKPSSERKLAMQEVLEKVSEGLLPPSDTRKPGAGAGARPNPKGGTGPEPRQRK